MGRVAERAQLQQQQAHLPSPVAAQYREVGSSLPPEPVACSCPAYAITRLGLGFT